MHFIYLFNFFYLVHFLKSKFHPYLFQEQRLRVELKFADAWADCVKWNVQRDKDLSSGSSDASSPVIEVSLSVASNEFNQAALGQLVEGLHLSDMLQFRMKSFSDQFYKYIIPFLIEPSCTIVESKSTGSNQVLVVKKSQPDWKSKGNKGKLKEKANSIPENELYKTVFEHLVTILEHLHAMLLHAEFGWQDISQVTPEADVSVNSCGPTKGTLMSFLGFEISPWLLDFLQRDIIAKAVPTSAKDLEGFEKVTSSTKALQGEIYVVKGLTLC